MMGLYTVELLLAIEREWSIRIHDEDIEALGIVSDLANYIINAATEQTNVNLKYDDVITKLANILDHKHGEKLC